MLAPLPGRPRTSSLGESFTSFLFTLFLVCFFFSFAWFCLPLFKKPKKISLVWFACFIQKQKKLVPALDGDMPTRVYPAGRFRLAQELASGPARRRLDQDLAWIQATGS